MNEKLIAIVIAIAALSFLIYNPTQAATTFVVGPGETHQSINSAVQAASNGDTINVKAGTYPEQVEINKQVTLKNFGDGQVWIDAACSRTHGIKITAANALVKGFGVKKSIDAGILISGLSAKNVTIESVAIQDFDCTNVGPQYRAGIGAWYAGSGLKLINNNIIRRVELPGGLTGGFSNGIWFKSNSQNPSGGGHLISGNIIKGVYDGIGGEVEDDPRGGFDKDTIIEKNTIDTCFDDGISVEGGTQNVKIRHNTIKRCALGIANAPTLTGPLYIEYNRITDGVPGHYGNVACFKMGNQGIGIAYYSSNTCILNGDGWAQTNFGMNAMVTRNNKIQVTRYVLEHTGWTNSAQESASSFDNDCLYTSDPDRFVKFNGSRYGSLAAWKQATSHEQNGVQSNTCPDPTGGTVSTPSPTTRPTVKPTTTPTPIVTPSPTPTVTSRPIPIPTPTPIIRKPWWCRYIPFVRSCR